MNLSISGCWSRHKNFRSWNSSICVEAYGVATLPPFAQTILSKLVSSNQTTTAFVMIRKTIEMIGKIHLSQYFWLHMLRMWLALHNAYLPPIRIQSTPVDSVNNVNQILEFGWKSFARYTRESTIVDKPSYGSGGREWYWWCWWWWWGHYDWNVGDARNTSLVYSEKLIFSASFLIYVEYEEIGSYVKPCIKFLAFTTDDYSLVVLKHIECPIP